MPQWFEYEPKNTFVHRLNPLVRFVVLFTTMMIISFYFDPRYLAAVGIVTGGLYLASRTPKRWLVIAVPGVIVQFFAYLPTSLGLSSSSLFKVYPAQLVSITFLQFIIPIINVKLAVTVGSFLWIFAQVLHIVLTVSVTFVLIYTTPLNDYVKVLRWLRVPQQITYVIALALKLVPDLLRDMSAIILAQRLRGWSIKTRNPVKAARNIGPFIYPLFGQTMRYVDRLTLSSQIRGFGTSGKGGEPGFVLRPVDYVIIALSFFIWGVVLYMLFRYNYGSL